MFTYIVSDVFIYIKIIYGLRLMNGNRIETQVNLKNGLIRKLRNIVDLY